METSFFWLGVETGVHTNVFMSLIVAVVTVTTATIRYYPPLIYKLWIHMNSKLPKDIISAPDNIF